MKIRKHKGDKQYEIMWRSRSAPGVETTRHPNIATTGPNLTAVLNAFLFGRDKTNIIATVVESTDTVCDPRIKTSYFGVLS